MILENYLPILSMSRCY